MLIRSYRKGGGALHAGSYRSTDELFRQTDEEASSPVRGEYPAGRVGRPDWSSRDIEWSNLATHVLAYRLKCCLCACKIKAPPRSSSPRIYGQNCCCQ